MSLLNDPQLSFTELKKLIYNRVKNSRETELRKLIESEKVIALLLKKDYSPIQLLVFHYLGFLDSLTDMGAATGNKKKILLSLIFKTEGFENIRIRLSDLSKLKTNTNLEILHDLFTELEMPDPLKKVKTDLHRKKKSGI